MPLLESGDVVLATRAARDKQQHMLLISTLMIN